MPWIANSSSARSSPGIRGSSPKTNCAAVYPPRHSQRFLTEVRVARNSSISSKVCRVHRPPCSSASRRFLSHPPCPSALPFCQGHSGRMTCCRTPHSSRPLSKAPLNSLPLSQMISWGRPKYRCYDSTKSFQAVVEVGVPPCAVLIGALTAIW